MTENNPCTIQIISETFQSENSKLFFNLKLSFHNTETEKENPSTAVSQSDLLYITFKQTKKIPDDVVDHINNNLGTYDLTEDETTHEKTMVFELKINDIDSKKILQVYDDFFMTRLSDAKFELDYKRSQSAENFANDLKQYSQVPVILHLIENSNLQVTANNHNLILDSFIQYLRSQSELDIAKFVKGFQFIQSLKAKFVYKSFKNGLDNDFSLASLDQRDLFKEFFLAFENPLVKYIFENGQDGKLNIKGRILNIINYEVNVELKNAAEFLYKVKTM